MKSKRIWLMLATTLVVLGACAPAATATPEVKATPTPAPAATPTPSSLASPATPTPKPAPTPTSPAVSGPGYGGTVRYPEREDPPTWDPTLSTVDPIIVTKTPVFSKLFTTWKLPPENCKETVTPLLVKDWKWVGDDSAEFTLWEGIRFHQRPPVTGRELVAEDIVFSMERFRLLSRMAGLSELVASTTAVDKYTFRLKTVQPWGGLPLELLAHDYGLFPMAKEAGGPKGDLWTDPIKSWIGVGPFQFERWLPGVKWSLVRNPEYWQKGKPYLDRVEYVVMPDASTQIAAIRSGTLTGAKLLPEILVRDLQAQIPNLQVISCPGIMAYPSFLYINNSAPPFNDVRVRRAVSMAIDRQAIIDTIYLGRASYNAILRPGLTYSMSLQDFPAEVRRYLEYRPDEARKLLAEAGYSRDLTTAINTSPRYAAPSMQINEMLVDMLGKVGIRAKLNLLEYGRYTQTVLQANYPAGEMATAPGGQFSPEDGPALRNVSKYGGAVNRSMVTDVEYDKLYDQFIAARDEAKRAELARQLQIREANQAYRVVLPFPVDPLIGPANLRGMYWRGAAKDWGVLLENMWFAR